MKYLLHTLKITNVKVLISSVLFSTTEQQLKNRDFLRERSWSFAWVREQNNKIRQFSSRLPDFCDRQKRQRTVAGRGWTSRLDGWAATDYPYSSSGKTREREVNVPLINSVKLSDRRIKKSAQVRSAKEGVGGWISVGYSWKVVFRVTEYVTVSHSVCGYIVISRQCRGKPSPFMKQQ